MWKKWRNTWHVLLSNMHLISTRYAMGCQYLDLIEYLSGLKAADYIVQLYEVHGEIENMGFGILCDRCLSPLSIHTGISLVWVVRLDAFGYKSQRIHHIETSS